MRRDGSASITKTNVQASDSITPKRRMQPVESMLPVMDETARAKAGKL
jgi:hypothetical protein